MEIDEKDKNLVKCFLESETASNQQINEAFTLLSNIFGVINFEKINELKLNVNDSVFLSQIMDVKRYKELSKQAEKDGIFKEFNLGLNEEFVNMNSIETFKNSPYLYQTSILYQDNIMYYEQSIHKPNGKHFITLALKSYESNGISITNRQIADYTNSKPEEQLEEIENQRIKQYFLKRPK